MVVLDTVEVLLAVMALMLVMMEVLGWLGVARGGAYWPICSVLSSRVLAVFMTSTLFW